MATEVDWSSYDPGSSNKRGKVDFIKFTDGKTARVRPIGKAVQFSKFFIETPNGNRSVCVDMENAEDATQLLSDHLGKDVSPSHRYAINVIDREDGKVKVLEGGKTIFNAFHAWAKEANAHPGGQGGGDWTIAATGAGLKRKYQTQYIKPSVITEDEKSMVKSVVQERSLEEVFKAIPLDNLVNFVFGERNSGGEPQPASAAQESNSDSIDGLDF